MSIEYIQKYNGNENFDCYFKLYREDHENYKEYEKYYNDYDKYDSYIDNYCNNNQVKYKSYKNNKKMHKRTYPIQFNWKH